MDKIIKYKYVESKIKPSDFYWGMFMIGALFCAVLFFVSNKNITFFYFAVINYIIGILIGHIEKVKKYVDYEKEFIK